MKSDATIKEDVLAELAWQPNIDETQVGVIVDKGVVTRTGTVDNYAMSPLQKNHDTLNII
jgi:osmotically-inducible protein OsmY